MSCFHATTEAEKKEIHKVFGKMLPIKVAANLSQKISTNSWQERVKPNDSVRLVNIARIAPEKNILYALEVLKLVKGSVQFDIYGPIYNEEYWNKCKHVIKEMSENVKVKYKGIIEQNRVLEVLKDYHFMFMPSTGENFGHVILQSFITGCPVIISDHTPWKNLKEKNIGWDLALLHPSSFAHVIDECVQMGQSRYDLLSKAAHENAVEYSSNHLYVEQNRHLFI